MKVSGFTIVRNIIKYCYPVLESIQSILPLCDEVIVNVGDCEDNTLELIKSLNDPKIKIIQNKWDFSQGKTVLSTQTNIALKECSGDWAFYLQSDEVIHEADLVNIKTAMERYLDDECVDALRFKWFHFYGSYYRYRIDGGWYQKQDRIIRNNGMVESYGDAYSFRRKDEKPLENRMANSFLYHYGWVHSPYVMTQRRINAEEIGFISLTEEERAKDYSYGDLNRFPVYFGTHPAVMNERINQHSLSQEDLKQIKRKYWCHPMRMFKVRYKTGKRIKEKIV